MKILDITYLVEPQDLVYDWLDVFITLDDKHSQSGNRYFVQVTTLQNLLKVMKKNKTQFVTPDYPSILVSELSDEVIKSAIQAFINDEKNAYWLKLYHIVNVLESKDLDPIIRKKVKEYEVRAAEVDAEVDAEIEAEKKNLRPESESDSNF